MTIKTFDQAVAGMQTPQFIFKAAAPSTHGKPLSSFFVAGIPGAAAASTAGLAGEALTSYPGQIPFPAIAAGKTRYLARLCADYPQTGMVLLCDRLWHNSGIDVTSTGSQTINSVAWPARDFNGATAGERVFIGVEVSSDLGAATSGISITYTNTAGAGSHAGQLIQTVIASSPTGCFYNFNVAAGDTGVQSIQTYQQTASLLSGAVSLVAFRVLAMLELTVPLGALALDILSGGRQALPANCVPFLIYHGAVSTFSGIMAQLVYTDG